VTSSRVTSLALARRAVAAAEIQQGEQFTLIGDQQLAYELVLHAGRCRTRPAPSRSRRHCARWRPWFDADEAAVQVFQPTAGREIVRHPGIGAGADRVAELAEEMRRRLVVLPDVRVGQIDELRHLYRQQRALDHRVHDRGRQAGASLRTTRPGTGRMRPGR
jgi:hypothetical protein